ncbi:hypothetical protein PCK1_000967 [Pneumocystis canis]|nr:hypothetical protein PCK1_000967 [Pneumocystis canis]
MSDLRNWILGGDFQKKNGLKRTKNEKIDPLNNDKKARKRIVCMRILSDSEDIVKEDKTKNNKKREAPLTKDHDLIPTNASQFFADKNKISRFSLISKKQKSKPDIVQENYIDDDDFSFNQSDLDEFEKIDEISRNDTNKQKLSKILNSADLKSDNFDMKPKSEGESFGKLEKTDIDTFSSTIANSSSNMENNEYTPVAEKKRNMKNKKTPEKALTHVNLTTNKENKSFENTMNIAQRVLDNCPLVSLSDIKVSEAKKINFYEQTNPGPLQSRTSEEIPIGRENCLSGLTFVFTGILKTIDREEGCNLVKRYGGLEALNKVYNNTSLNDFFFTQGKTLEKRKNKFVLIMDEVDGVSAGDSGGIGELNVFIKKTMIPIICICNDRASRKLLPLDRTTFDLKFRRPDVNSLRSRIMSIAYREELKLEPHAIDHAKAAEKDIVMKPWDIVGKFLSGGIFKHTSKVTLNDKIEFYFNDHELSHLMLQENYLKTQPDTLNSIINSKQKNYEHLKLIENASEAISQSDLIDSMIHGPQQHWSLMPLHAIFSCVIPAFFVSGFATSQYSFTSVLGNIAKTNKLIRYLRNLYAHISLKTTGNCDQIRQFYIPLLFDLLLRRLETQGQNAIPNIIKLMDDYFLTKEDSEYILELGIGPNNANLLKMYWKKCMWSNY